MDVRQTDCPDENKRVDTTRLTPEMLAPEFATMSLSRSVFSGRSYQTMHTEACPKSSAQILRRTVTMPLPKTVPIPQTIAYHDNAAKIVALNKQEIDQLNADFPQIIIQKIREHHYLLTLPYRIDVAGAISMKQNLFAKLALAAAPGARFYLHITSEALCSYSDFFDGLNSAIGKKIISIQCDLSGFSQALEDTDMQSKQKITDGLIKIFNLAMYFQRVSFSNAQKIPGSIFHTLLQKCPNIIELILSDCKELTDENLKDILKGCSKLLACTLSGCEKLTDAALQELVQKCPQLIALDASETKITDSFFSFLACQSRSLRLVTLRNCAITDAALSIMAMWPLYRLDIRHCMHVTVSGIKQIQPNVSHEFLVEGLSDEILTYQRVDPNRQNRSIETLLSTTNELQFIDFCEHLQATFFETSAEVVGNWLNITIKSGASRAVTKSLDGYIPFIQKHCVQCAIGVSFFSKPTVSTPFMFLQNIAPHVMHLTCMNEHAFDNVGALLHQWNFPKLEYLDLSNCSGVEKLLHVIQSPSLLKINFKQCKHVSIQALSERIKKFPKLQKIDVRGVVNTYQELAYLAKNASSELFIKFRANEMLSPQLFSQDDSIDLVTALVKVLSKEPLEHKKALNTLVACLNVTIQNVVLLLQLAAECQQRELSTKCQSFLIQRFGWTVFRLSYEETHFILTFFLQSLASMHDKNSLEQFLQQNFTGKRIHLVLNDDTTYDTQNKLPWLMSQFNGAHCIKLHYMYKEKTQAVTPRALASSKKIHIPFIQHRPSDSVICEPFYNSRTCSYLLPLAEFCQSSPSMKELIFENLSQESMEELIAFSKTCARLEKLTLVSCTFSSTQFKMILDSFTNMYVLSIKDSPNFSSDYFNCLDRSYPIRELDLSGCKNCTSLLPILQKMPKLETLNVRLTAVEDNALKEVRFWDLRTLDLSFTNISDHALGWLAASGMKLHELILDGTGISSRGFAYFQTHPLVTLLRLSLNKCLNLNDTEQAATDIVRQVSDSFPNLEHLELSGNGSVSEKAIVQILRACDHIKTIKADNCRLLLHLYSLLDTDKQSKILEFDFSEYTTDDTIEIRMRKAPFAKVLLLRSFSKCRIEHFVKMLKFYADKGALHSIQLDGCTADISEHLKQVLHYLPHLRALSLSGAITKQSALETTGFLQLKRLEIRNTLDGGGNSCCSGDTLQQLAYKNLEVLVLEQITELTSKSLQTVIAATQQLQTLELIHCENPLSQTNVSLEQIAALHKSVSHLTIRCVYFNQQFKEETFIFQKMLTE